MASSLKQKVVQGTFWVLLQKFCRIFAGFGVTLVLARLLTPADYGTVALLTVFIAIAGTLVDAGFGDALVQKKNATELDFNSVFYLSIVLSATFYLILFITAPFIAEFYKVPELVPILRVLAISLILNSVNSVQMAELNRKLLFDRGFKINMISMVASSTTGILLAYLGYGPWAIVWTTLSGGFVTVVAYWTIIAWRPKLMFSWGALRSLFGFGWKMIGVSLIDKVYTNLYGLLIGRYYSPADLALVNKGRSLPCLLADTVNGTINGVSFPAMAQLQDDMDRVRVGMRKMLLCSTFFVFPLMAGLAASADTVVYLFYGENWLPCVPYMRIVCFSFAVFPFHSINLFTLLALGHSGVFLKVEIVKKIVGLLLIVLSLRHSVLAFVLASTLVFDPFAVVVNTRPVKRIIGYSLRRQLQDVAPMGAACLVMGGVVYAVNLVSPLFERALPTHYLAMLALLLVQVCVGIVVYGGIAYCGRFAALGECLRIVRNKLDARAPRISTFICSRFKECA